MARSRTEALRLTADLLGVLCSGVVLLLAGLVYLVPGLVLPVSPAVGLGIGVVTLSLPGWAVIQSYTLRVNGDVLDSAHRKWLLGGAAGALVAFVLGFTVVALRPNGPARWVGDAVYGGGMVLLLAVSTSSLALRRRTD